MEKLLLANERITTFEVEGMVQGQKVKGKFRAKYPSIMDTLAIQKESSNLLKDSNPDTLMNQAYDMAYIVAFLSVLLVEKPEWFDYDILDDSKIIFAVYEKVSDFVDTFRSGNESAGHPETSDKAVDQKTVESK